MPLAWSKVIPTGWSQHHRPVTEGAMTAACLITRAGEGESVFDPETGEMTPPPRMTIYEGKCRVQQLGEGTSVTVADQGLVIASTLVVVPWDVEHIWVGDHGDRVEITQTDEDEELLTRKLYVAAMLTASLRWERDLFCASDVTRSNPTGGK